MANHGELTPHVWPPYVGLSTTEGEPIDDPNYGRGLISWRTEPDGSILGSARILAPKGIYTHVVFYSGPRKEHPPMPGHEPQQVPHPVVFDRPGTIEINPIRNGEYLPRQGW